MNYIVFCSIFVTEFNQKCKPSLSVNIYRHLCFHVKFYLKLHEFSKHSPPQPPTSYIIYNRLFLLLINLLFFFWEALTLRYSVYWKFVPSDLMFTRTVLTRHMVNWSPHADKNKNTHSHT